MAGKSKKKSSLAPMDLIGFAVAGALALAMIVLGAMYSTFPWAMPGIVAGFVSAGLVALCFWRGSAALAIHSVVLVLSASAIASGARYGSGQWHLALICIGLAGLMLGSISLAHVLRSAASAASTGTGLPGTPSADPRVIRLLEQMSEHTMLTDNTRRVLFRTRELDLLRATIEEDINHGDYDAALVLCDDMGQRFGAREEAEQFRSRILRARHEHYEANVQAAVSRLDQMLAERDWSHAHEEAARIRRLFPDAAVAADLDQRINAARQDHKRDLEGRFIDAAGREDVETAMPLLRELDRYLSQEDATRLRELAQGVIARHRENLGVQFKLAVNDRRWAEAARIGQAIIEEFPNSKMAVEVRPMLDVLRTRATQAAVASNED